MVSALRKHVVSKNFYLKHYKNIYESTVFFADYQTIKFTDEITINLNDFLQVRSIFYKYKMEIYTFSYCSYYLNLKSHL